MGIVDRIMKRRKAREIAALKADFADDCVVYISENTSLSIDDYIAAEEAVFASFPDLTIDYDESEVDDEKGNAMVEVECVITGTFSGVDYVYGDQPAIVASGAAISKPSVWTFTVVDDKVTKLVIVGLDPKSLYATVAVTES